MITPDNPDYITVLRGVGVWQAAHMSYAAKDESYFLLRVWKARKNEEDAQHDAEYESKRLKLEIR